jgi:hypothetical protein
MTLIDQAILAFAASGQQIIRDAERCDFCMLVYQRGPVAAAQVGEIKTRVTEAQPQNPSRWSSPRVR